MDNSWKYFPDRYSDEEVGFKSNFFLYSQIWTISPGRIIQNYTHFPKCFRWIIPLIQMNIFRFSISDQYEPQYIRKNISIQNVWLITFPLCINCFSDLDYSFIRILIISVALVRIAVLFNIPLRPVNINIILLYSFNRRVTIVSIRVKLLSS